ncbi:MAG: SIS domain-containing protein [Anaerocolumna sp.]
MEQINRYFNDINQLSEKVRTTQQAELEKAAALISDCIKKDGLIYVYGSGHAHMSAEELFYRAGGLGNVYPIFIEALMLHEAAALSSQLEKREGYLTDIVGNLPISDKDVVIVVSTSGRNATPMDTALIAQKKGAKLITIFSREYSMSAQSGHSSKKRLLDLGDARIDNGAPIGDAVLSIEGVDAKFSPVSSVVNLTILQSIVAEAIAICVKDGVKYIPVFKSGNMTGGTEYNQSILEKYRDRVPALK